MKPAIFIITTICILLTSCATISNDYWTKSTIYTTEQSIIIFNGDSIATKNNKAKLRLKRQKKPIELTLITETLNKKVKIGFINSFEYYENIFTNYGIGMLVDRKSLKRYDYPAKIYINSNDTLNRYSRYGRANNKGEFLLHLSLPHINSFNLTPELETKKANTGFWGLSIGLDYFHSKKQFFNFSATGVSDFLIPFPAPVDIGGEYELMTSSYLSLSNNHQIKRYSFGYGICYAKNSWDFRYYDRFDPPPPTRNPVKKSNSALGLVFLSYFKLGQHFNIGTIYRPTFVRLNSSETFKYEHLISLDLAWKIRLNKK